MVAESPFADLVALESAVLLQETKKVEAINKQNKIRMVMICAKIGKRDIRWPAGFTAHLVVHKLRPVLFKITHYC